MILISIFYSIILFPFNHPFLYAIFSFINFLLAVFLYKKLLPFYSSSSNIHDKYPQFNRCDSVSFTRLLLGLQFLFWPRLILLVSTLWMLSVFLFIGDPKNKMLNTFKDYVYKNTMYVLLFAFGCVKHNIIKKDDVCSEVYKKYLGNNYVISYNKKYATVISNHCSFLDIFFLASQFACSYIAKKSIEKIPLIKTIAKYLNTMYIDRTNEAERHKMAEAIAQRQKDIIESTIRRPLSIFPEGTVSNGKYIIKFKRGAFSSLLPIKPMIEVIDHNKTFSLGSGVTSLHLHIIYGMCFLYTTETYIDLPIIEPTDYMYEQNKNFGEEKWMIYMEVCRHIMSEVSGLELSDAGFNEKLKYISEIKGKKVKNT